VDDLGWADVGCYGSTFYHTPNLDRMAAQGMKFTSAYTAGSVCSPTRASILTGRYPARVNITDYLPGLKPPRGGWSTPEDLNQLPLEEVTLAEELRRRGYQTFYAGKWHLGGKGFGPTEQGFEIVGEDDEDSDWKKNPLASDRLTGTAIRFLENRDQARPFLLYLSYHKVHTPILPYPKHIGDYEQAAAKLSLSVAEPLPERGGKSRSRQDDPAYASEVQAVDDHVGQLLGKIESLGLATNTVFVFFSDNGGLCTRKSPGPTCNLPLRAGKGWLYEGGVRVPLILHAPGLVGPGSESNVPVISTDFFPTFLELAGLPLQPGLHQDGVSFAPLLRGEDALAREPLYWHYPHYHGSTWEPGGAIRQGDWKLIEFFTEGKAELYNLRSDLGERLNLASRNPEKVKELLSLLVDWRKAVGARMPVRP
jgi:arylsulfatase A-like enzyme